MQKAAGLDYEETGEGEAVLLIHGAIIADAMLPLTREAALSDRYRVIRYRRRGHGGSDPAPATYSIAQQAQDAAALLRELGVERAHVVGHSGGGTIAVQLALEAPELVHTLALLEPATLPPDLKPTFLENAGPVLEAYHAGDPSRAVDLWMEMVSVGTKDWRDEIANTVPGGAEQGVKDAGTFFETDFPAFRDWSLDSERASTIRQPMLYVVGSESGPMVEVFKGYFLSLFPTSEEALVTGVDHAMQMADAKRVAAPIAEFIGRHAM